VTIRIQIDARYNGPPKSGNGGYCCGLMANLIGGSATVSLKAPPPLETQIELRRVDGKVEMHEGGRLIGVAEAATLDLEVPKLPNPLILTGSPVSASGKPAAFAPFSGCFVCGTNRKHRDGLCIYSKMVDGHDDMVAGVWHLHDGLADTEGNVMPEFLWSALDCPGYFACAPGEAALLGKLTTEIIAPLPASGDATVLGWDLGGSGRKRRSGTAVFDRDRKLIAKAEGLWILVDPAMMTS